MSVRVRKFLGYGLADVRFRAGRVADARINPACPLVNPDADEPDTDAYAAWLADNSSDPNGSFDAHLISNRSARPRLASRRLSDCCELEDPSGSTGAMLLAPFSCPDWARSDDPIDWVAETYLTQPAQQRRLDGLPDGLYPWGSRFMDARDGRELPTYEAARYKRAVNDPAGHWDLDGYAQALGFDHHPDAQQHMAPFVPYELRDLADYTKLFRKPDAWTQLRPMLLTHWR